VLIGITGKAGAGKDSVANILVDRYGFKRYAFADAVRDVALSINPIIMTNWQADERSGKLRLCDARLADYVEVHGWDWSKRNIPEIRRLLQVIGTEAGRQVMGENVWVDIIVNKYVNDGYPNGVVTDMRFPNEFEAIADNLDECTLKVVRPNNPDAIEAKHSSEQYDFDTRYTIMNDGTLEDLGKAVDDFLIEATYDDRFTV